MLRVLKQPKWSQFLDPIWSVLESSFCEPIQWIDFSQLASSNAAAALRQDEIDVVQGLYSITNNSFVFSVPVYLSDRVFSIPSVRAIREKPWYWPTFVTQVFAPALWSAIVAIFVYMLILSTSLWRRHLSSWDWFSHYLGQHTVSAPRSALPTSVQIMLGMTAIYTMHSVALYEGCLLTQLLHQQPYEPSVGTFDDLAELIGSKRAVLDLRLRPNSMVEYLFHTEGMKELDTLRAALKINPPIFSMDSNNDDDTSALPADTPKVLVGHRDAFLAEISETDCDRVMVETGWQSVKGFMFSPMIAESKRECLNAAILDNSAQITAELESFRARKQREYFKCRKNMYEEQIGHVGDPIRLVKVGETFVFLFIGLVLSLVIFGCESLI